MKTIELLKKALMMIALLGITCGFAACSDDKDDPDPNQLDSRKTAIITQYVNGVSSPLTVHWPTKPSNSPPSVRNCVRIPHKARWMNAVNRGSAPANIGN